MFVCTHRVVGAVGVHTAAVLEGHALVVAEDEARVTRAALHAHASAPRGAAGAHARLRAGAAAQCVGAVGRTGLRCWWRERERERERVSDTRGDGDGDGERQRNREREKEREKDGERQR